MITINSLNLTINNNMILEDIDLNFQDGEIYGLVGNNGCGKTMLMKCICGFVKPSSGKVVCDNKVIGKDIDYLHGAGVIIESPVFIPYYSGFKNLKILAQISKRIDDAGIRSSMTRCGLDPDLKLSVRKYSLGMRQRLALAQAIMEETGILILDEPMNGLDIDGIREIRELLFRYKENGCLIILASHNAEDIKLLCDKVIRMDKGRVIEAYNVSSSV